MNSKNPFSSMAFDAGWLRFLSPLLVLVLCSNAWAACNYQDIDIQCQNHQQGNAKYDNPPGTPIMDQIALCPAPQQQTTKVTWTFAAGVNCSTGPTGPVTCSDGSYTMVLKAPAPPGLDPSTFSGNVPSGYGNFDITVTDTSNSSIYCKRHYDFNLTNTAGGWGDPHITTVDGVHYNFQSAGEFIALRGEGLEIQTRQTPIATTFIPGPESYAELKTCVSVYSAVATRVGKHRVTYEPDISGVPDPSGMQLRVDGVLTKLGSDGIDLGSGGRIVKLPTGEGNIEIDYSDGTRLVVTPGYWSDQQKWYLSVNVTGTTATEGIFGRLAVVSELGKSWLPALPDGTSLGPRPDDLHERYVELYQKFADAWRVTDKTSLFDYGPGTSTATFTREEWPRENPQSCAIEGQPSAGPPIDVSVAETLCSAITDKNMRADCVFDVNVTGYTGFAQTYQTTEHLQPGATETRVKDDKNPTKYGESVTFTATVAQRVSRSGGAPAGSVQFIVDGGNAGNPVTLDANGRASWSTSSLQEGQHKILAKYTPTGWGGLFLASSSPEESHTVLSASSFYWWLVILLIIVLLIAFIVWRYFRTI